MGIISKDSFKKLVLLYLIGKFKDGVYTRYRFQKTLYFSTKNIESHPFTFQHTQHGQYSYNASRIQDSLVWINMLVQSGLPEKEDAGAKWSLAKNDTSKYLANLLPKISPDLSHSIDRGVNECGYLISKDLVKMAESDDLLLNTPMGSILFEENLNNIEIPIDEDESEEIDLALNDRFLVSMDRIMEAIEVTDFNLGEVKGGSIF